MQGFQLLSKGSAQGEINVADVLCQFFTTCMILWFDLPALRSAQVGAVGWWVNSHQTKCVNFYQLPCSCKLSPLCVKRVTWRWQSFLCWLQPYTLLLPDHAGSLSPIMPACDSLLTMRWLPAGLTHSLLSSSRCFAGRRLLWCQVPRTIPSPDPVPVPVASQSCSPSLTPKPFVSSGRCLCPDSFPSNRRWSWEAWNASGCFSWRDFGAIRGGMVLLSSYFYWKWELWLVISSCTKTTMCSLLQTCGKAMKLFMQLNVIVLGEKYFSLVAEVCGVGRSW